MEYKLIINPFAEQELKDATEWYNLQQENLGGDFLQEIDKTITRITENPFQFPKERKQIRKAIVKRFPYLLFFYVDDLIINVFAVFNTSRNPMIWKSRFKDKV